MMCGHATAACLTQCRMSCRWCPAGRHIVVTTAEGAMRRYSSFYGAQLLASFVMP